MTHTFTFKDLDDEKDVEVTAARNATHLTRRVTVPALEDILFRPIAVLDHGSLSVINYMGDDSTIVDNARVSYGKGTRKVSEDKALIAYLLRHRHTTPFEGCEIQFRCKMPIFVARQWIRHRTANVNEYSARYSVLSNEFYIPEVANMLAQSKNNKQGRAGEPIVEAHDVQRLIEFHSNASYAMYQTLLNSEEMPSDQIEWDDGLYESLHSQFEEFFVRRADQQYAGLARELARMVMPVNGYTEWTWKIDLHNLLHFLGLRNDPHAQYEIRVYAQAMWEVVKLWCPLAAAAFENVRMNGVSFTGHQMDVLRQMMRQTWLESVQPHHEAAVPVGSFEAAVNRLDLDWARGISPEISKREFDDLKAELLKDR